MINDARKRKVTSGRISLISLNFFTVRQGLPVTGYRDGRRCAVECRAFQGPDWNAEWRSASVFGGVRSNAGVSLSTGVLRMKSRESLVRLKEFQVKDKRRQLAQLQLMMSEFERMSKELESQIAIEEKKSGITDPGHFAYPTFAKAARQRSDNLQVSIRELKVQQDAAELALEEAEAEFAKASALEERDNAVRMRA
jgi:hypothetical protein